MFLARAETGRLQFYWDSLDLAELTASAAEDFALMAQDDEVSVDWDAPTGPVQVQGDKQRLRQVLLTTPAARKPGSRITARLRAENGKAVFSLSDQGIPSQELEHIFDRHFRGTNARRLDGSGLPMTQAIITAHGGKIAVASAENTGTTFTITLPLIFLGDLPHG